MAENNLINKYEYVIVGGGMVGLSIAYQLLERNISKNICIIDKEVSVGMHSSGRNSGVIHAGVYYKNDSLKAKVCVRGGKRLVKWAQNKGLTINNCGKVIVAQKNYLDKQLDLIANRGRKNGAQIEIINEKELKKLIPEARTASGRALWSPNTKIIKPIEVIDSLKSELIERGVKFYFSQNKYKIIVKDQEIHLKNEEAIQYEYLFNCAGLQADKIAHIFNVGREYSIIPFKGMYWDINKNFPSTIKRNLYPVPDLNMPFLGVHFTPSANKQQPVTIGPTATFAWGRENYSGLKAIEPLVSIRNLAILSKNYIFNENSMRRYIHEQSTLSYTPFLIKAAKELVPSIRLEHIQLSQKVGIRSQLFNNQTKKLEDDFISLKGKSSTHILNAISPAFTASFELADLVINMSNIY